VLRLVEVGGDATARGRALGRALAPEIHASLHSYRRRLDAHGVGPVELERLLASYRAAAGRRLPALAAMLDAMAAGAEADPVELFAVNAFEELDPLLERREAAAQRCTTFTAVAPGATILAHSEHWLAEDAENVALVVERPVDGPALVSPTVACCLPAVGLNARGAAQGIDSLTALDDGPGVPRVLVSRHALEAADKDDAVRRAGLAGRAGGYGHVFAFAGGETLTVETTAERLAVLEGSGGHTNHYLDPDLAELERGEVDRSRARHARLQELLRRRAPRTPEDAMTVLQDDGLAPASPEYATLFAMVCDVDSGRLWLAPGDPREHAYDEVDLADVV
jgi:isopenicillin-N N-acyltransferase like protein